jgi:putative hemolysin
LTLLFEICLAIFLLGLSAFFSAAEIALVSLSPQKTKQLAVKNPQLTQHLLGWLTKPHELIIVILIGNTLTTVMFAGLLTMIAIRTFPGMQRSHVELVAWALQTIIVVVLGEMAPKFIGRVYSDTISFFALPWLARARDWFGFFLRPLSNFLAKFFPSWSTPPVGSLFTFSMEELRQLLEEDQARTGHKESLTMMQKVIDINTKTIRDIMVPIQNVDSVDIDSLKGRDRIVDWIIENGHTRTPVRRNGRFIGYIHSHDLLPLMFGQRETPLEDMVTAAPSFSADMKISDLLQVLRFSDVHIGFVKDNTQSIIGIVTLEDVMEEITGEILDEYDVTQVQTEQP